MMHRGRAAGILLDKNAQELASDAHRSERVQADDEAISEAGGGVTFAAELGEALEVTDAVEVTIAGLRPLHDPHAVFTPR